MLTNLLRAVRANVSRLAEEPASRGEKTPTDGVGDGARDTVLWNAVPQHMLLKCFFG